MKVMQLMFHMGVSVAEMRVQNMALRVRAVRCLEIKKSPCARHVTTGVWLCPYHVARKI